METQGGNTKWKHKVETQGEGGKHNITADVTYEWSANHKKSTHVKVESRELLLYRRQISCHISELSMAMVISMAARWMARDK